jgi:cell division protein FtsL
MPARTRDQWIAVFAAGLEPSAAAQRSAARNAARVGAKARSETRSARVGGRAAGGDLALSQIRPGGQRIERAETHFPAISRASRYYGLEATARVPQPMVEPEAGKQRPELTVITRRRPRRVGIALLLTVAVLIIGLGVVAPTLIGAAATGMESNIGRLERQQEEVDAAMSALSAQVSSLSSPARVAQSALGLGLGPAASVYYVGVDGDHAITHR